MSDCLLTVQFMNAPLITHFPVRPNTIETTNVADGSEELPFAEAVKLLERGETDLLQGLWGRQRQIAVRVSPTSHAEVLVEEDDDQSGGSRKRHGSMIYRDGMVALDAGMTKLLRRAGVLVESALVHSELHLETLSKYMNACIPKVLTRAQHAFRLDVELHDVVASKVV